MKKLQRLLGVCLAATFIATSVAPYVSYADEVNYVPETEAAVETIEEPTTAAPVYEEPTTEAPVYEEPVTEAPVYEEPTTTAPVYEEPTTAAPVYEEPTTAAPVYEEPTTAAPVYEEPTTAAPEETTTEEEITYTNVLTYNPTATKWDFQTYASLMYGAQVPDTSKLEIKDRDYMAYWWYGNNYTTMYTTFLKPIADKIAAEYGLDKTNEDFNDIFKETYLYEFSIKDKDDNETKPAMELAMTIPNKDVVTMLNEGKAVVRVFLYNKYDLNINKMFDTTTYGAPIWWDTYYNTFSTKFKTEDCPDAYVAVVVLDAEAMTKVKKDTQPTATDGGEDEGDGEDADADSQIPEITRALKYGQTGEDVVYLQTVLAELGYYEGEATGNFDDATYLAVTAFQTDYALEADGQVGKLTWEALAAAKAAAQENEVYFMDEEEKTDENQDEDLVEETPVVTEEIVGEEEEVEIPAFSPIAEERTFFSAPVLMGARTVMEEEETENIAILREGNSSPYNSAMEMGEDLYGENAHNPTTQLFFGVTGGPSGPVYAGDNLITYTVSWGLDPAPKWGDGVIDSDRPIFDWYTDSKFILTLPAGLLLVGVGGGYLWEPDDKDNSVEHTYTIYLNNKQPIGASSSHGEEFTLNVYVCDNGTANSIHDAANNNIFDLSDKITFHTEFSIVDKTQNPPVTTDYHYEQNAVDDLTNITTDTPDVWGVEKSLTTSTTDKPNPTIKDGYAVFEYKLVVGLVDGQGNVKKQLSDYNNDGRDELDSITLTDTLSEILTKKSGTSTVVPSSVSIRKEGGSEQAIEDPSTRKIEVSLADGTAENPNPLALNRGISVDTNYDHEVDYAVTTFTTYYVTVKYEVTDDLIAEFYENDTYNLASTNQAKLTYKLARKEEITTTPVTANGDIDLPVTEPVKLNITKKLIDKDGNTINYSHDDDWGAITYLLESVAEEGQDAPEFTVYKLEDGEYSEVTGKIDITSTNTDDKTTYYLSRDYSYKVTEPEASFSATQKANMKFARYENNTYTKDGAKTWAVTVYNSETKGRVKIIKSGDDGKKIGGVVFTLTNTEDATKTYTITTAEQTGIGISDYIPYGVYTLEETSCPNTYSNTFTTTEVTINDTTVNEENNKTIEITAVNKANTATITLTKYVGISEATISNKANSTYPGTFILQYTDKENPSESDWKDAVDINGQKVTPSAVNVRNDGTLEYIVPAFNPDNSTIVYSYRFRETLPSGYYDPATGVVGSASEPFTYSYSNVVKLVDPETNKAKSASVNMYNRKLVNVRIFKNFYKVDSQGKTTGTDNVPRVNVTLWRYKGEKETLTAADIEQVSPTDPQSIGGGTGAGNDHADWTGLKIYSNTPDPNDSTKMLKYHYLVKETDAGTYLLDSTQAGKVWKIGNDNYIEIPVTETGSQDYTNETRVDFTLTNRQQLIPVQIWKRDYYSGNPLPDAHVTVYDAAGNIAQSYNNETHSSTSLNDVLVQTGSNYNITIYLAPGQKYTFVESTIPDDLEFYTYDVYENSSAEYATEGIVGTIDLTGPNYVQTSDNSSDTKQVTRTIYNAPDPEIYIEKKDSSTNAIIDPTSEGTKKAQFTVFTKNADGTFTPVTDEDGSPIVITANTASSSFDDAIRLTPGVDYYFAETQMPTGDYLDPNEDFEEYSKKYPGQYEQGDTTEDTPRHLTFVKGTVHDLTPAPTAPGQGKNLCTFTFYNIPNKGNMIVEKYLDGALSTSHEFDITVSVGEELIDTKTTDKGKATFSDLPVYDDDGNKITYIISENLSDDQKEKYYQVSDPQDVQLTVGETITEYPATTTDEETGETIPGTPLRVENKSYIDLEMTKYKINAWQWEHGGGVGEFLAGTTIGLYEKDPEDDVWTYTEKTVETSSTGYADFGKLERDKDYALVELSCTDATLFPYDIATDTAKDYPEGTPQTIPDSSDDPEVKDISDYNVLKLLSTEMQPGETKYYLGSMYNTNHWVQFHLTKWADNDKDGKINQNTYLEYSSQKAYFPAVVDEETGSEITPADVVYYGGKYWRCIHATTGAWTPDHWQEISSAGDAKLDNCVFSIWQYILDPEDDSVTFDRNDSNWKLVGTYTTGTLYDENGHRLPGEFLSDIYSGIDENYVYLIIEDSKGPNNVIMSDNYRYTFWYEQSRGPIECIPDDANVNVRYSEYLLDNQWHTDVLNLTPEGPGASDILLASLRLAKWRYEVKKDDEGNPIVDENGNPVMEYLPLSNAKFSMKLAYEDIDEVEIGTLTSGKDGGLEYAIDQSGTFRLQLGIKADPEHGIPEDIPNARVLIDYETGSSTPKTYRVEDITTFEDETYYVTVDDEEGNPVQIQKTRRIYKVAINLYETSAPVGYGYSTSPYRTYLCFVDEDLEDNGHEYWYFSDLYLVKDTLETTHLAENQQGRLWYVTEVTTADSENPIHYGVGPIQRIVDYPMDNTMVTIHKFGYVPNSNTRNETSLDLYNDEDVDITMLNKVTMTLEVWKDADEESGTEAGWVYWDANNNQEAGHFNDNDEWVPDVYSFETDANGSYMFPVGLPKGTYRVIETSLGTHTEYENAYPDADHARIFTVGTLGQDIYMANPEKISITITKKNADGSATLKGAKFKLTGTDLAGNTYSKELTTGDNGVITFEGIPSGTSYQLTETQAPSGYTKDEWKTIFIKEYDALKTLVNGTGMDLGYDYDVVQTESEEVENFVTEQDTIITSITPSNPSHLSLTIKDPKLVQLQLQKYFEANHAANTNLGSATFRVYYHPFTDITGETDTEITPVEDIEGFDITRHNDWRDQGWTYLNKGNDYTTTRTGQITTITYPATSDGGTTNYVVPGVYAFYERSASRDTSSTLNTDIIYRTDGKNIVYYAVVTGGLPVTVTGISEKVNAYRATSQDPPFKEVKRLYTTETGGIVKVEVENRDKVQLTAYKEVNSSELDLNQRTLQWEIKLKLYDGDTLVGVTSIKNNTTQINNNGQYLIYFYVPDNNGNPTTKRAWFSQGKSYRLEEEVVSSERDFRQMSQISEILSDESTVKIDPDENGLYLFPIESVNGFTVKVTNDWLLGKVTFRKYGETNSGDLLHDAEFNRVEAYQIVDPDADPVVWDWVEVTGASVAEDTTRVDGEVIKLGTYTATIPLVSAEATRYRIYETKAPDGYLIDQTEQGYIEATLSFENNVKGPDDPDLIVSDKLYLTNPKGNRINITKYDNLSTADSQFHVGLGEATFRIYQLGADDTWTVLEEELSTNEEGVVTFVTTPGVTYGIEETYCDGTKFIGLEGVFDGEKTPLTKVILNGDDEDEENDIILYTIVSPAAGSPDLELIANNIPIFERKIVKKDVGGYPENVKAAMDFSIYEVPANFAFTPENVTTYLTEDHSADLVVQSSTNTWDSVNEYSYYTWKDELDPEKCWNPTKTYLLVETSVFDKDHKEDPIYDTMRKDYPGVVWFTKIGSNTNPSATNLPIIELDNVNGEATVVLTKELVKTQSDIVLDAENNPVVDGEGNAYVESLLKAPDTGYNMVYTISPDVTSANQPLDKFIVSENGLTFSPTSTTGPQPSYSITSIYVGKAYHDPSVFGLSSADITAVITFKGTINGTAFTETSEPINVTKDKGAEGYIPITNVPAGTTSFDIEYYSSDVRDYYNTEAQPDNAISKKTIYKNLYAEDHVYSLGEDFEVNATTVFITVNKLQDGKADDPVKEIEEFTNTATVDWNYSKWSRDGQSISIEGKPISETVKTIVKPITRPRIKITKDSTTDVASVKSEVEYVITIENIETPDAMPFENPVVLDILPTGVTYIADSARVGGAAEGETAIGSQDEEFSWSLERIDGESTHIVDGTPISAQETAELFKLTGSLKPGSNIKITFKAYVSEGAGVFLTGDEPCLENDVFLSSSKHTFHTTDNKQGYSFENEEGAIPDPGLLADEAAELSTEAGQKEAALHDALNAADNNEGYAGIDYIWVKNKDRLPFNEYSGLTPIKSVQGDRDPGLNDAEGFIGTATRNNSTEGVEYSDGWVDFGLTVKNDQQRDRNQIVIADYLPREEDDRNTWWNVIWDHITSVSLNEQTVAASNYTVYYYTGSAESAKSAIGDALNQNVKWDTNEAWPQISESALPTGWMSAAAFDAQENSEGAKTKEDITAFAIVFTKFEEHEDGSTTGFQLTKGGTLVITYHTKVEDIPTNEEFKGKAFENACNDFYINHEGLFRIQQSNPVYVTLLDQPIWVEGDLWIDEDWDAKQEEGNATGSLYSDNPNGNGNHRDYNEYDIINQLAAGTTFYAIDKRASSGARKEAVYETAENDNIGYGESIKHFRINDLGAAFHLPDSPYDLYVNRVLNKLALKTSDPYIYELYSEIKSTEENQFDTSIFEITDIDEELYYLSEDPDVPATGSSAYMLDNNFYPQGDIYKTSPFYLRYSVKTDQTWDIGVKMKRDLEITKVAQDDPDLKLQYAEFQLYGPFKETDNDSTATNKLMKFIKVVEEDEEGNVVSTTYEYDPTGTAEGAVDTLVTDANGKIKITGLNWWKEYIIKETKAAPGYDLDGAIATTPTDPKIGTIIEQLEDDKGNPIEAWRLKLPGTKKVVKSDQITISNPRRVKVKLGVEKFFTSSSLQSFIFKFDLQLTSIEPKKPLETLNKDLMYKYDEETEQDVVNTIQTLEMIVEPKKDTTTGKYLYNNDGTVQYGIWDEETRTYSDPIAEFEDVVLNGLGNVANEDGLVEGIYHFTIIEQALTNTTEGVDNSDTVAYEDNTLAKRTKYATVTVVWDNDEEHNNEEDIAAGLWQPGLKVKSIVYTPDQVTATVIVTDEEGLPIIDEETGEPVTEERPFEAFYNKYEATGTWTPTFTKVLKGNREPATLTAGEFEFEIWNAIEKLDEEGEPTGEYIIDPAYNDPVMTGSNAADGTVTFETEVIDPETGDPVLDPDTGDPVTVDHLTYDLSDLGDHYYIIQEVRRTDEQGNVDTDYLYPDDQLVKVNVAEQKTKKEGKDIYLKNGQLDVTSDLPEDYEMINIYVKASVDFDGTKSLYVPGSDETLPPKDTFTFVLKQVQINGDDITPILIGTETNDEEGKFAFSSSKYDALKYSLSDFYVDGEFTPTVTRTYEISETLGTWTDDSNTYGDALTYDETVYTVTVTLEYKVENGNPSITVTKDFAPEPATQGVVDFTNEVCSIEKYVEKDVHYEMPNYQKVFTYDIIAYVTKDADTTTITDVLEDELMFAVADNSDVEVVDLGETEPDHTAGENGSVSTISGTAINSELLKITKQTTTKPYTLEVVVKDSTTLRGHWIKVTFTAKFDKDYIKSYADYKAAEVPISDNGLVISARYPTHKGIPNTASYEIITGNGQYESTSNTVTVTPPDQGQLKIKKFAQDDKEQVVANARFQIYGPFEPGVEGNTSGKPLTFKMVQLPPDEQEKGAKAAGKTVYEYDPDSDITDLVTDSKGEIYVTGLPWWSEFIIKEVEDEDNAGFTTADGYLVFDTNNSCLGEGTHFVALDKPGEWRLIIDASYDYIANGPTESINVYDPRIVKVKLGVFKEFDSYSEQEFTFTYDLSLVKIEKLDHTQAPWLGEDLYVLNEHLFNVTEPLPEFKAFKLSKADAPYVDANGNTYEPFDFDTKTITIAPVRDSSTGEIIPGPDGKPVYKIMITDEYGNVTYQDPYEFFDEITLYGEGIYTFWITERKETNKVGDQIDAVEYDTNDTNSVAERTKAAIVTVEGDPKDNGKLKVTSIKYSDEQTVGKDTFEKFNNHYEATGIWTPNIWKILEINTTDGNRPYANEDYISKMQPGEFKFEIYEVVEELDEVGNPTNKDILVMSGENVDSAGTVEMKTPDGEDHLTYHLKDLGDHQYIIKEIRNTVLDEEGNPIPDPDYVFASDVPVTIAVEEDHNDDKTVYYKNGKLIIIPDPIESIKPIATEPGEGDNGTAVEDDSNNQYGPYNPYNGYEMRNVYADVFVELKGLKKLVKDTAEQFTDIDFERIYEREMKPGEFVFNLYKYGEEDEPIATATNDADGNFIFTGDPKESAAEYYSKELYYTLKDLDRKDNSEEFEETTQKYYTIKEIKPEPKDWDPYIDYDEDPIYVTVTLWYDADAEDIFWKVEYSRTDPLAATGSEEGSGDETTAEGGGDDTTMAEGSGDDTTTAEGGGDDTTPAEEPTAVFTNKYQPSIEKYVNEDVHANLASYKKVFTYDIIAYVTKDAVTTTITDALVPALKFRSEADEITVLDIGDFAPNYEPNHTAGDQGDVHKSKLTGKPIDATVTVDSEQKILTVVITECEEKGLRGHWVQITFDACIDETVIDPDNYQTYLDAKDEIEHNGLVISALYPTHEGIPNKASYTIDAENDYTYNSESNTVTVTPPQLGKFQIVKTLSDFVDEEPPTFVFSVQVWYNPDDPADWKHGELVYDNVEQIAFTTFGTKSVTIEKIPLNAHVLVEESYSGGRYTAEEDITQLEANVSVVMAADAIADVTFTNFGNNNFGGHGILNEFIYGEEDRKWEHEAKDSGADQDKAKAPLE